MERTDMVSVPAIWESVMLSNEMAHKEVGYNPPNRLYFMFFYALVCPKADMDCAIFRVMGPNHKDKDRVEVGFGHDGEVARIWSL